MNNRENESIERVKKNIDSACRTIMIGSLDEMEKAFGHLWGHNEENPTEEQEQWFAIWQEVRTRILDKGHNSAHWLKNNMDQYSVQKKRYHYNFRLR